MKKKLALTIAILASLLLAGCASPQNTVKGYMDALKAYDFNTLQTYLQDSNASTVDEFNSSGSASVFFDYMSKEASSITYTIGDIVKTGDTATVKVTINYSDASKIYKEAMNDTVSQSTKVTTSDEQISQDQTIQLLQSIFLLKCATMTPEPATVEVEFTCTKTGSEWFITKIPDEISDVATCNLLDAID